MLEMKTCVVEIPQVNSHKSVFLPTHAQNTGMEYKCILPIAKDFGGALLSWDSKIFVEL